MKGKLASSGTSDLVKLECKLVPFSGLQRCDPPSVMELPSPVSDEVLLRPPQDPDSGGPNQDCEISRVVDAAAQDLAEFSPTPVDQACGLIGALTWPGF